MGKSPGGEGQGCGARLKGQISSYGPSNTEGFSILTTLQLHLCKQTIGQVCIYGCTSFLRGVSVQFVRNMFQNAFVRGGNGICGLF